MPITISEWVRPVPARASAASSAEPRSQGERLPSRLRVRSESVPPTTVPSMLVIAPTTAKVV